MSDMRGSHVYSSLFLAAALALPAYAKPAPRWIAVTEVVDQRSEYLGAVVHYGTFRNAREASEFCRAIIAVKQPRVKCQPVPLVRPAEVKGVHP